jgi:hypothetical protein
MILEAHFRTDSIHITTSVSRRLNIMLINTLDVMINSVVLRPGNLHQYPVLSCGKDVHDYHITKNFSGIFILSYYFLRKKSIVQSCLNQFINHHIICFFSYRMAENKYVNRKLKGRGDGGIPCHERLW